MRTVQVTIRGRVQGVGFRAWVEDEASERSLAGWVRNRRDGSVEALFAGADPDISGMIEACRRGPPAAQVEMVDAHEAAGPPGPGFRVLPTA